ncbi:MarR family winged helix-turn-helix transcriptional regulator [Castellaniella defragrans]|jgi:DNA-binding MarR family transcriptional regulator|uniref:MarR family winged helix-turn-helix transcriptional regulator n=1 Tax=Castellaniella defragrans TaxID=75697 RepID=UPI0023F2F0EE|nr:MarR family winged helix-turn-helix transcriptional regulator [Castellaniella defragrans]
MNDRSRRRPAPRPPAGAPPAPAPGPAASPAGPDPQARAPFSHYLTFKLDLVKSAMLRPANEAYRREFGLDVRALRLLRAICDIPGVTATRLHELTLVEKTLLSKDLKTLIERRLVRRSISPEDARQYRLQATAQGRKIRAASDTLGHAMENVLLAALTPEEHAQLDLLLDKLLWKFQEEGGRDWPALPDSHP